MSDIDLQKWFETVSPLSIETGKKSVRLGISRRFLLFRALSWITRKIEDDPHLNFVTILKSYKALTDVLDGSLYELHRDRDSLYFRTFFIDDRLYEIVKEDLEWVYARCKKSSETISVTITKRGVMVYDNYREDTFNVLLMTIHSGTWMREDIQKRQTLTENERLLEEDIDTHKIYADLVLKNAGIWIDNKASRFACDYNRSPERAIYDNGTEEWVDVIWSEPLTKDQRAWLMEGYNEFYHTLKSIVKTHQFNIIFDAHSMKDGPDRAGISFGTKYIPKFYMPIVNSMLQTMRKRGYKDVALNKPFSGGHIIKWMASIFPDRFVFSMEVNKRLYMTKNRNKVVKQDCEKLAKNISGIFDI